MVGRAHGETPHDLGTSGISAFLHARSWIKAETVEVTLEHMPKYEILASSAEFVKLARTALDAARSTSRLAGRTPSSARR
jgi:hypothetical protein